MFFLSAIHGNVIVHLGFNFPLILLTWSLSLVFWLVLKGFCSLQLAMLRDRLGPANKI